MSGRPDSRLPLIGRPGLWRFSVTAALAGWFAVTVVSQHPNRTFDRLRRYDRSGLLIPNWRFFAPEPARHDFQLLHRVLTSEGDETEWKETLRFVPRTWTQAVWFPSRRRDKAVFDVCHELLGYMREGRDVTGSPAYMLLSDFVETRVCEESGDRGLPRGFQFLVVRHTGHDQEHDPDYILVSHFVPLNTGSTGNDWLAVARSWPGGS